MTYRPLIFAPAPANDVLIDLPSAGETVTDPLVVTGRCNGSPAELELMIDDTPVANFNHRGYFRGSDFVLEAPVEFVSEGAHAGRGVAARATAGRIARSSCGGPRRE